MSSSSVVSIFNPLRISEVLAEELEDLERFSGRRTRDDMLIVPWRSMLNANKLHLTEEYLKNHIFHQTILKWEWDTPINVVILSHFKKVFSTSINTKLGVINYCYPDYVRKSIFCDEKDRLFCFAGWENNFLRKRIFEAFSSCSSVIKNDRYTLLSERNQKKQDAYDKMLNSSRFSLCPRGTGNGTRRFWESLAAGAIPILISDEFEPPRCWNWGDTIIRVSEKSAATYPENLIHCMIITSAREKELRRNCLSAHAFFSNPLNLVEYFNN